jgi:hypothetical protein
LGGDVRFLDEILNKTGMPLPPGLTVITADEVARYLYEQMPERLSLHDDFPNIAPPFQFMAVECLLKGESRDGRGGRLMCKIDTRRIVWLSQNIEIRPGDNAAGAVAAYIKMLLLHRTCFDGERGIINTLRTVEQARPRWVCSVLVFDESCFDREPLGTGSPAGALVCVMPDGKILIDSDQRPIIIITTHPALKGTAIESEAGSFFYPYFLTLSFMHCKNIELHDVPNENSFVRRFTKWHGRPPVQYKELNIQPMQKVIRTAASEHKTDIRQAMHICRGHFKDYRQRGLFGKLKDVFWWDQSLRGSESEGVINKSYKVNLEKKKQEETGRDE